MIISIGYRVKSSRGIAFRRWATSILKDYIMQGYVVNEKSKGALEGIIGSVYRTVFGEDANPTVREKAANLLYFIVKDHPFTDGCKRIAASIFLYF